MNARQSSLAPLNRLGPLLESAQIQEAEVGGLHHAQKTLEDLTHSIEELREFGEQFAAAQLTGILDGDFDPQDPLALVVDLEQHTPPTEL